MVTLLKWGEMQAAGQRPLHDSVYTRTSEPHRLTLVDDGPTSFAKRLAIIDAAESTLELEFFIYELDLTSRLITQKLVEKARQGVKVRLLIDFSFTVLKLEPVYGDYLRRHGVEVRYYNTSAAYRLLASQHRSHRKLLIADDRVVMTGGRNIGDDYFHVSSRINFLESLAQKGVSVTVLTNSLASTDAFYAVSALHLSLREFAHTPLALYAYDGTPAPALIELPIETTARWGVHSKRAVIDQETVVIGTYNVDPRSAVLNSEILIVCRNNRALADEMRADITRRMDNAWPVLVNHELDRSALLRSTTLASRVKFYLALPLAAAFDFLL